MNSSSALEFYHICVVAFHHKDGNKIEFIHPELTDEEKNTYDFDVVPFLGMPDSVHMSDSDSVFFILPPKMKDSSDENAQKHNAQPLYGVVCFQQVDSESVKAASTSEQAAQITRSSVQKSVVLLLSQPLFETYLRRLIPVTQSYFAQLNFEPSILVDFFNSLVAVSRRDAGKTASTNQSKSDLKCVYDNYLHVVQDVPVRSIVQCVGARHALQIVKLLLAEQRVVIAACKGNIHRACQLVMFAASMVPLVLGAPPFFPQPPASSEKPTVSDKSNEALEKLLHDQGFPLALFDEGDSDKPDTAFAPYMCLQQMSELTSKRFFIAGVSNPLFLRPAATNAAAVFELNDETGTTTVKVVFADDSVSQIAALTGADKRFADGIDSVLQRTSEDATDFVGSSDWVRGQFMQYIRGLMTCYTHQQLCAFKEAEKAKAASATSSQPESAEPAKPSTDDEVKPSAEASEKSEPEKPPESASTDESKKTETEEKTKADEAKPDSTEASEPQPVTAAAATASTDGAGGSTGNAEETDSAAKHTVPERNDIGLYGDAFLTAWTQTRSFGIWWSAQRDCLDNVETVWKKTEALHPGGESFLQGVGRGIQKGFVEDFQPFARKVGSNISSAAISLGRIVKEKSHKAQAALKDMNEKNREAAAQKKQQEENVQSQDGEQKQEPEKKEGEQETTQKRVSKWWSALSRNVVNTVSRVGKTVENGFQKMAESDKSASTAQAAPSDEPASDLPPKEPLPESIVQEINTEPKEEPDAAPKESSASAPSTSTSDDTSKTPAASE